MTTSALAPSLAVQQLLQDLQHDTALQATVSGSSTEQIVALCQSRGVYVDPLLLDQFLVQLAPDEQDDHELSLDQLEDVAGGLGIADVMVSGAVLAVVASNAGGLMSQAQAAISGPGSPGVPVASLMADATIAGQVNSLERLGIQVQVAPTSIQGASAQWDAGSRTMTISPATLRSGAPAVLDAINHESVHVAQSCKAGGIGAAGVALGIAVTEEGQNAVQHAAYANASAEEQQMEREAYSLTREAGAGVAMAEQVCGNAG